MCFTDLPFQTDKIEQCSNNRATMGGLSPICPFSYPLFCERLTSLGSAIQRPASRAQRAQLLLSLGIVRFAIVHDEFHSTEASFCYKHGEGWGRIRARGDWMALLCSLTLCTMQTGPKEHQSFVIMALSRGCGGCVCKSSIRRDDILGEQSKMPPLSNERSWRLCVIPWLSCTSQREGMGFKWTLAPITLLF